MLRVLAHLAGPVCELDAQGAVSLSRECFVSLVLQEQDQCAERDL